MKKFCQSCGMPLDDSSLLGTEKDGSPTHDYCIYCYKEGAFEEPDITMEEMIEVCVPYMVEQGFDEEKARKMLAEFLPTLNRWVNRDE
ncbi:zinc ribbon domain-containing protein [Aminobacterium sp. MB27-C1]|jgi:hypothetical protein|uniref:zinc ribbon domain-containing protein n=1 Tax=Aminobacterium sp. MB27-C1 TaxID=3070661 RepID=UPI001BD0C7DB|nr:zinc ribbon domain-containing protein [Aminobacterium sp. MB27-C1]WMI72224.1 zinc ribbon domain-containing protein [Aminobacterium sp. MB27-C1]